MKKFWKKGFIYSIVFIFILLSILLFFSTKWGLDFYNFLDFDEILFQLTAPLQGTESSIIDSYVTNAAFPSLKLTFIVFIIFIIINIYLSAKSLKIDIKLWQKKYSFNIKMVYLRIALVVIVFISSLTLVGISLNDLGFFNYFKRNVLNSSIDFYEENYVNPKDVKLTFPEEKRNLVYIYVESLESSFFDKENGGSNKENPMVPLMDLMNENTFFSNTESIGGFYSYVGTSFTSGSLVAQTAGVTLRINNYSVNAAKYSNFLSGAYSLGDILEKEGYNQIFMIGSDKTFGNRGIYFENHGNYYVYDYNEALKLKAIPRNYSEGWGIEDGKLFNLAKEELSKLSKDEKPFNFTILTTNTHPPKGLLEDDCSGTFESEYSNAIYCSVQQVNDFVRWIQEQDFYEKTTIIIVGDHISTVMDYIDDVKERYVYNLIINSPISTENTKNRDFSAMDMYPTTLAAMGVSIEGDQLGLGTNLYSDKETLSEKYGEDEYDRLLSYSSSYYSKNILKKSKHN